MRAVTERRPTRRLRRDERGVALVEFALILPIFVVIMAGILAFGRVFFYWIETNHQANEMARWAAVDRNPYAPTTLQQRIAGSSTGEFQSDVKVCIDFPGGQTDANVQIGDSVRVRVQKPFNFIPILDIGQITIAGSSTMRMERLANARAFSTASSAQIGAPCS